MFSLMFDIVEAHYLAACEWGDYRRVTRITSPNGRIKARIRPGLQHSDDLTEEGQRIYQDLSIRYAQNRVKQ